MTSIERQNLAGLLSALLLPLVGCDSPSDPGGKVDTGVHLSIAATEGLHFMTQDVEPPIVMEALYLGEVSADAAGCIRLAGPEPAAVIWPEGFTVRSGGDGDVVFHADGSELGSLGGEFAFGGGYVSDLHEGLGFSPEDRALAGERCPGAFWIVGEVSRWVRSPG